MNKIDQVLNGHDIQLEISYKDCINSRVNKVYEATSTKLLHISTLPLFFILWPIIYCVIYGGAKVEVDSALAHERLSFINGLSNQFSKFKNCQSSLKDIFNDYLLIDGENEKYDRLFSSEQEELIIKLALIYRDARQAGQLNFSDSSDVWETLMKTEKTIQRALEIANGFNQSMGKEQFSYAFGDTYTNSLYSLTHAENLRKASETECAVRKETHHKSIESIKNYGISKETLDSITEAMILCMPITEEEREAAYTKAHLQVLEVLQECDFNNPVELQTYLSNVNTCFDRALLGENELNNKQIASIIAEKRASHSQPITPAIKTSSTAPIQKSTKLRHEVELSVFNEMVKTDVCNEELTSFISNICEDEGGLERSQLWRACTGTTDCIRASLTSYLADPKVKKELSLSGNVTPQMSLEKDLDTLYKTVKFSYTPKTKITIQTALDFSLINSDTSNTLSKYANASAKLTIDLTQPAFELVCEDIQAALFDNENNEADEFVSD